MHTGIHEYLLIEQVKVPFIPINEVLLFSQENEGSENWRVQTDSPRKCELTIALQDFYLQILTLWNSWDSLPGN